MIDENPYYRERAPLWWFWTLSYAGGEYMRGSVLNSLAGRALSRFAPTRDVRDTSIDFLWRFEGEAGHRYSDRLDRARYDRLAGAALDAVVAGLTQGVSDPEVPPALAPMLEDVDGRGTGWAEWRIMKATLAGMCGHVHVGVDLPDEEMVANGVRPAGLPFMYLIPALSLPDWEVDEDGTWVRAVVRECRGGVDRYRHWTRDEVWVTDARGAEVAGSRIVNPFGLVPISTTFYAPDPLTAGQRMGRAWMESPARVNQHHYNVGSWIDEIAFRVTFPSLAIPVPDGESSVAPEQKVAMGPGQALGFSGGGLPQWLSPPRESIDVLRDLRSEDVQLIRQAAGLSSPEAAGSKEMPSGEALRQLRQNLGALLGAFAQQMASGDERDLMLAQELQGSTGEVHAPYPTDYAGSDSISRLDEVERAYALLRDVPSASTSLLRTAFQVVLPGADADTRDAVARQLEQRREDAEKAAEDGTPKETLNGAQVSSLLEVLRSVSAREIPREAGIQMVVMAFSLTLEQATALFADAGEGPAPEPATPAAVPDARTRGEVDIGGVPRQS